LPATGAEVFGIVGLGSVVTSAGYYLTSRRRLGKI
jgi:LPXTG-motif cell wall-anchored protein